MPEEENKTILHGLKRLTEKYAFPLGCGGILRRNPGVQRRQIREVETSTESMTVQKQREKRFSEVFAARRLRAEIW